MTTRRLSPEIRKKIHETNSSYRQVAEEFDTSVASVARWKHRKDFQGKERTCKYSGRLSEFEKAIFRESIRLTKYHFKKLVEFLAPLWEEMPTAYRLEQRTNTKKCEQGVESPTAVTLYSPRTLYRLLKGTSKKEEEEEKEKKLHEIFDRKTPEIGILAIHAVRIQWLKGRRDKKQAPTPVNGEVLCFFERYTGFLYLKLYRDRVGYDSLIRSIRHFLRMCPVKIKSVKLVNYEDEWGDGKRKSTVIRDPEEHMEAFLKENLGAEIDISFDQPKTPEQEKRIVLPKVFESRKALENAIAAKVNAYNSEKREVVKGKRWQDFTPREMLWRLCAVNRRSHKERLAFNQRVSIPIRDDSSGDGER